MKPTTVLESMPPERNAPIGTSLTICMRTDSSRRARIALDPLALAETAGRSRRGMRQ